MTASQNSQNAKSGLSTWRARQAEEKARRMAELERYRADAIPVAREGRVFSLVRIPDHYDFKPLRPARPT